MFQEMFIKSVAVTCGVYAGLTLSSFVKEIIIRAFVSRLDEAYKYTSFYKEEEKSEVEHDA